jgi:poly [ADP-ribose] polymerase
MAAVVEKKKFICVEFGVTNNNKFWQYTIYDDGTALTEWGRVGGHTSSLVTTKSKALSKMREKTNPNNEPDKRYTEVKAVDTTASTSSGSVSSVSNNQLKTLAQKQIKTTSKIVQDLIDFLVKVNAHQILQGSGGQIQYDESSATFKTPMGVIDPSQVKEARSLLTKLADLVADSDFDNRSFGRLLNEYLRLVPHNVGMSKITPRLILPSVSAVQKENDLLDGLESSFATVTAEDTTTVKKAKKDNDPKVFDVELEKVTDEKIISWARNLYQTTRKDMHQSNNLSVQSVYAVTINTMKKSFETVGQKIGNVMQLWHGTKASNLLSIMRKGLIIPPSSSPHCTGRMYGNGLYFSSISTKSLNYATNFWGGSGNMDRTFMFLADVAMGKPYIASYSGSHFPVSGYQSTWAKGGQSGVINDEMIVYDVRQTNLIYLVEFVPRSQYKG